MSLRIQTPDTLSNYLEEYDVILDVDLILITMMVIHVPYLSTKEYICHVILCFNRCDNKVFSQVYNYSVSISDIQQNQQY